MANHSRIKFVNAIELNARELATDSISFDGGAGQLFSVTDNLTTGSIFSVNDISGIPSIDVAANGVIQLAPYSATEYVGIGLTNPSEKLHVSGNFRIDDGVPIVNYTTTSTTYTVTVDTKTSAHRYTGQGSASAYFINAVESPYLDLQPGRTYRFDQSDSSNSSHPLLFYLDAAKTTQYTTNVTTNGTAGSTNAYTQIVVTETTPSVLYYQCSAHAYMGNAVNTNSEFIDSIGGISSTSFLRSDVADVKTSGNLNFSDDVKITFGDGNDLEIYHNANNASYIRDVGTGNLNIDSTGGNIQIRVNGSESAIIAKQNNAVELYYDNAKKFETASGGVSVAGIATATSFSGSGSSLTGLTGASQGTYGDSVNTPVITVDSNGRITGIATVATSGGGGGGGGINNIVEDITPQLGGPLDLNSKRIIHDGSGLGGTDGDISFIPTNAVFNTTAGGMQINVRNVSSGTWSTHTILGPNITIAGSVTANSFVKSGGTSSQYLMADGSVTTSAGGGGSSGISTSLAIAYAVALG